MYPLKTRAHSSNTDSYYVYHMDQVDSPFADPTYLSRLPRYRKNFSSRIDETKTLLFRLGSNPIYTDDALVYIGHHHNRPYFCSVEHKDHIESRKIEFDSELRKLVTGKVEEEIKKVGWIVLDGNKWGFLLDLSSLEEIYKGHMPEFWQRLMRFEFFIEQFRRFAFYYQQELNTNLKEIPSTEIDEPIPPVFCPLEPKLFLHQRQEVGWMFNLENNPLLPIPGKVKAIPFLDSGYYLNPKDHTKLIKEVTKGQIEMRGGVLASQVGSGKTVSMIGLMTIGSQLKGKSIIKSEAVMKDVEEEKKINGLEETKEDGYVDKEKALEELSGILKGRYEPTLVIVTKNILHQWKQELEEFAPGLNVFLLEKWEQVKDLGFEKKGNEMVLKDIDVVLTHRKIIEEGHKMFLKVCEEIYMVRFRRVIYDEFHELITQSLLQSDKGKGVQEHSHSHSDILEVIDLKSFSSCVKNLRRDFTWGLTGTPDNMEFHKHTQILFELLNLNQQYSDINIYQTLRNTFVKNFMRSNPCKVNLKGLEKSVRRINLYQIQNLLYKGKLNYATNEKEAQLLCSHLLPQYKNLENEPDNIELAVKAIEQKHQEEIKKVDSKLKELEPKEDKDSKEIEEVKEVVKEDKESKDFKEKERNIKILRDRLQALEEENNFYMETSRLLLGEEFDCPICMMSVENQKLVVTGCVHQVCVDCYKKLIESVQNPVCMLCKEYLVDNELIIHPRYRGEKENKLTVIVKAIQETPPEDKVIIFTQFHSLVERLEEIFTGLDLRYMVLKGQPTEINIALNKFKTIPDIKILLMSIEQSASGINVTAANHVFFAHPIFGMPFEKAALTYNQCIGRANRIGQKKKVYVKLFVTSDSLEDDMVPSFYKY